MSPERFENNESPAEKLRSEVKRLATSMGFGNFIDLPTGRTMVFANEDTGKVGPNFQFSTHDGELQIVGSDLSRPDFQPLKDKLMATYPDTKVVGR